MQFIGPWVEAGVRGVASCTAGWMGGLRNGRNGQASPLLPGEPPHRGPPKAEIQGGIICIANNINDNINNKACVIIYQEICPEIKGL